ncbi:FTL_1709 family lipoprotein [Francisella-like endosymbiont]|uniref:FTL_1709 family lipoprotein n=1 Tax=Francisella-like endosymbiont TaxID=512373 RepID=UPI003CD03B62
MLLSSVFKISVIAICSKITKVVFSKKIIIAMFMALLVTSCTTDSYQARELPLLKHGYSKKKLTAYNIFGFRYDNAPRGIFNVIDEKPTEFLVNIYIGDNQDCKFIYTADTKGKQDEITQTGSFTAYLSSRNELLKLECKGKDSNIDYKVITYVNAIEYDRVGSLSYLVESGGL